MSVTANSKDENKTHQIKKKSNLYTRQPSEMYMSYIINKWILRQIYCL